jgi:catechol 2,3-dioxygenase
MHQHQPATPPHAGAIDPRTTIGSVALSVSDLERSLAFYTGAIGLEPLARADGSATLGAGGVPLLELTAVPGARPWTEHATGLYHFALLLPTREDLGRWLRHWLQLGFPLPGQGDHLVSEALYLRDPDGHGIEVYRDRPRAEWRWQGDRVVMDSLPVDTPGLLALADASGVSWAGAPPATRIGHIHLQVADIPAAEAFFHGVMGWDVVATWPGALFVSAGGYHHHLGLNTWHSRGRGPAGDDVAKLLSYTVDFADEAARDAVVSRLRAAGYAVSDGPGRSMITSDPCTNTVILRSAGDA